MGKRIEATGKTIDEAISTALQELQVDRDDVEVEILQTAKKGLFGVINNVPAKVLVTLREDAQARARDFLQEVCEKMNVHAEVDVTEQGDELVIQLSGDKMGVLIGRRGETLDALQYLTRLVVNRDGDEYKKVSLDTENYRQKREETLQKLAQRLAGKVMKTHRSVSLEPMNAYERKIIHAALQGNHKISTQSVGEEPNRKIVITYRDRERRRTDKAEK